MHLPLAPRKIASSAGVAAREGGGGAGRTGGCRRRTSRRERVPRRGAAALRAGGERKGRPHASRDLVRLRWAGEEDGALPSRTSRRPRTRGDCLPGGANEARPCPFVSCRWHLYLNASRDSRQIQLNRPTKFPEELTRSCVLDVTDEGEATLREVAEMFGLTRERIRQIEANGHEKLARLRLTQSLHGELGRSSEHTFAPSDEAGVGAGRGSSPARRPPYRPVAPTRAPWRRA